MAHCECGRRRWKSGGAPLVGRPRIAGRCPKMLSVRNDKGGLALIRLLVAEDVQMVRGALVALLELEPDLTVVADVGSGDEIVPTALTVRPDLAVIDIDLPGRDGLTAAAELCEE